MNHNNTHEHESTVYSIHNFLPLIIVGMLIILFTVTKQLLFGLNIHTAMYDFMGSFFIVFSLFKIINLNGFAEAYSTYDIIAKRYSGYAYIYPFIELTLGILYLTRLQLVLANWTTLILMIIGSIGIIQTLMKKETVTCACLGTVFKIPMTYVTLAEDILMGLMALIMLLYNF